MRNPIVSNVLGLAGAAIGAVAGIVIVYWISRSGFYGMMIPGALLGLGCSMLAQHRSLARGIVCGVAAVLLGLFTEWYCFPFLADDSLKYFVAHLGDLKPLTLLMIGVGGLLGFWMGRDANPLFVASDRPKPEVSSDRE
jgi:hypothetical protein